MKNTFVVEQKPLLAILASMQPICTKRTTIDATSTILFYIGHKELGMKSTDLEISLQASTTLKESTLDEPRQFLVSGRRIFDVVKELEGDIVCTVTDQQIELQSNSVRLALNSKDAQEFPPFPERIENLMQLEAPILLEMLNKVAFLIPQNNANPALNGLFLEIGNEFKMTATDGHCLAQASTNKYSLEQPKKWLLPRRAVFEVKKLLEASENPIIFLGTCGNQLVFSGESFNFFTKLLNDTFPHYAAIMDRKEFLPARVDRSNIIKTLRRSSCLLSGQFLATSFGFSQERLKVSMHNKEVGRLEEELPLQGFEGQELDIRFYAPYLLSGLQVFSDEEIHFYLKSSGKPIIFESQGEFCHLLYLVMPVAPTNG
jgi:DNA polymerase-3 subunit beta